MITARKFDYVNKKILDMKKLYFLLAATVGLIQINGQACTTPTISVNSPTVCAGTSATLNATTDGQVVKWYSSQTATDPIAMGTTYTTPALSANTSYWVESYNYSNGATPTNGGKVSPSGTGTSSVVTASSPWGLAFTANSDFLIETVDVYGAGTGGNMVIKLLDASYAIITEKTVTIPSGGTASAPLKVTIPINFSVIGGNSYKLVASSSPVLIRDFSGNAFPYSLGSFGSITGGTINNSNTNSTVYYFFYNWRISPLPACASGRVESLVTVNTVAAPVASSPQTLPAGSTLSNVVITGQNISWFANAALTTPIPATTPVVNGTTYYATQTVNGCTSAATPVTINVGLSVVDVKQSRFQVYPNPAVDIVNIKGNELSSTIEVYDLSGKLIMNEPVQQKDTQLNISSLRTGNYRMVIKTSSGSYHASIIKK